MRHPQLYKGLNVVWVRGCETFHLAALPRGVIFTPGEARTLCGKLVLLPVIEEADMERRILSGEENCPKCFKAYAKHKDTQTR